MKSRVIILSVILVLGIIHSLMITSSTYKEGKSPVIIDKSRVMSGYSGETVLVRYLGNDIPLNLDLRKRISLLEGNKVEIMYHDLNPKLSPSILFIDMMVMVIVLLYVVGIFGLILGDTFIVWVIDDLY